MPQSISFRGRDIKAQSTKILLILLTMANGPNPSRTFDDRDPISTDQAALDLNPSLSFYVKYSLMTPFPLYPPMAETHLRQFGQLIT